jgi:formamidopyrimidine-DNA glycosylase
MNNESKNYILNIRLSQNTYQKVKNLAKENAESISQLVRKVIYDGLDIASDISEDILGKNKKTSNITNYYRGTAAQGLTCANCGHKIKSGATITIGESSFGKKYYYCSNCK